MTSGGTEADIAANGLLDNITPPIRDRQILSNRRRPPAKKSYAVIENTKRSIDYNFLRRSTLKICIVSDSHDHREPLAAAVAEAKALGAQAVLHCGDLVAPSTLHAIVGLGLPIHLIHGNNSGDLFHLCRFAHEHPNQIRYYGQDGSLELAERRIFLVHYPHYARGVALTGSYDLVCNGHEHRATIERIRNIKGEVTLRIDPGTVAGVSAPATYAFGDLRTLEFAIRPVPRHDARFAESD